MLSLSSRLAGQLDIPTAVEQEAQWQPDLVPTSLASAYAAQNVATTAQLIAELSQAPLDIRPAETLSASKWRYGRRPVAMLPFQERVLYRAVVNRIRDELPECERGSEVRQQFEQSPVDYGGSYVVVTDVANFYSSIPIDRLCTELIERSGAWEPIQWLGEFWRQVSNGGNGIPQVSEPSDLVAEAYADELHRRLLRRGMACWRYADDFRIAASSKSVAVRSLETFDDEARNLGLFVNERKTYIPPISVYDSHRDLLKHVPELAISEDLSGIFVVDPYSLEADVDEEKLEELRGSAKRILAFWLDTRVKDPSPDLPVPVQLHITSAVRRALNVLGRLAEPDILRYCSQVIEHEPQLTPSVSAYLATVAYVYPERAIDSFKEVIQMVPLYRWQRYWLLDALGDINLSHYRSADPDIIAWMRGNLGDTSESVRSKALWSLARNHSASFEDWRSVSLNETSLGSPYVAAAINTVNTKGIDAEPLVSSRKFDGLVREWAAKEHYIHPPF